MGVDCTGGIKNSFYDIHRLVATKPFCCAVTYYVGQTKMPFEKQIKQFLLGTLRCVSICCRKCFIEARKATAEVGTAAGALAGEVF